MTANGAANVSGADLVAAGWEQGVLFTAPSAQVSWLERSGQQTQNKARPLRQTDKLILISQTCDVQVDIGTEPRVEALVCSILPAEMVRRIGPSSARFFVITRDEKLVAVARDRVQVSKKVLPQLRPDPWPGNSYERGEFVRWLARRYDRPAAPDEMVTSFDRPVGAAIRELFDEQPDIGAAFNRKVREIRINLPESETTPFELELIFLIANPQITGEEARALDKVFAAAYAAADAQVVHLAPGARILTPDQMSVAEYFSTARLFFDDLTIEGHLAGGAEPMGW